MLEAALIKEQGVAVAVRDGIVDNISEAEQVIDAMSICFRCPAALMGAQSPHARETGLGAVLEPSPLFTTPMAKVEPRSVSRSLHP